MQLTHAKPRKGLCDPRPAIAPPSSIAATLATMRFLYHGSLATAFAAIRAERTQEVSK